MVVKRNTKQKQLIFWLFEDSKQPLTAGEVYERALKYQPGIAKSTIYRNLDTMLRQGEIIQGMMQNGESFYSLSNGHNHSHYLICKKCRLRVDFPKCPLGDMERNLAGTSGFLITDHTLQIFGYCRECQKNI